jgi:hypothetical protein
MRDSITNPLDKYRAGYLLVHNHQHPLIPQKKARKEIRAPRNQVFVYRAFTQHPPG